MQLVVTPQGDKRCYTLLVHAFPDRHDQLMQSTTTLLSCLARTPFFLSFVRLSAIRSSSESTRTSCTPGDSGQHNRLHCMSLPRERKKNPAPVPHREDSTLRRGAPLGMATGWHATPPTTHNPHLTSSPVGALAGKGDHMVAVNCCMFGCKRKRPSFLVGHKTGPQSWGGSQPCQQAAPGQAPLLLIPGRQSWAPIVGT